MGNGKMTYQKLKDELNDKGCEFGRNIFKELKHSVDDINNIGKKMNYIIYGLIILSLLLLGNSEVAAKLILKLLGL